MKFNGSDNIEVDKNDQVKINTFSRLNMQYHELIRLNLG
jgi:prefoldin subunit 4